MALARRASTLCAILLGSMWAVTLSDSRSFHSHPFPLQKVSTSLLPENAPRGGFKLFAGMHPFGYKITALGEQFLSFNGVKESDLGRLLSSLKSRKTFSTIKQEWVELTRFSKTAQAAHIMRSLREMLDFLLAAGLID